MVRTPAMIAVAVTCQMLCMGGSAGAQSVIYVDDDAPPGGDGANWSTAYSDLQDALAAAAASGGTVDEIRVAEGTYHPTGPNGDRLATFVLDAHAVLRGGYAGLAGTDPDERDIVAYPTVLSGDLNDNDGPDFTNNLENSHNVVTSAGAGGASVLDGVTITGGNADGFADQTEGGGLHHEAGSLLLTQCVINGNWGKAGGGVYVNGVVTATEIVDCTITGNMTPFNGGGLHLMSTFPTLTRCLIDDNQAGAKGGGIYNRWGSPQVNDCTISNNVVTGGNGGGGLYCDNGDPTLRSCLFVGNHVGPAGNRYGGGIACVEFAKPTLFDCTFDGNSAGPGGGILAVSSSEPTLTDCTFRNCSGTNGGALNNSVDCVAILTRCTFVGNTASGSGGAINNSVDATLTLTRCRFYGNSATGTGAGGVDTFGEAAMTACLFSGNETASNGGALRCLGSTGVTTVEHCSFSGNTAGSQGGGIYMATVFHDLSVENSIFWGNLDSGGITESAQLRTLSGGLVTVNYSDLQMWSGALGGTGNSADDPQFTDAAGADGLVGTVDDDLHLLPLSTAINAGDPAFTAPPGTTDLDGYPRVMCGRVDKGAYESGIGDIDCNGVADLADFANWAFCLTGPAGGPLTPGCQALDFEADDDVDLADFAGLQQVLAP
ncbi:MAG: hypothetical protein GY778_00795 [bacterium]|nr:hypothetical protein [bacterium]